MSPTSPVTSFLFYKMLKPDYLIPIHWSLHKPLVAHAWMWLKRTFSKLPIKKSIPRLFKRLECKPCWFNSSNLSTIGKNNTPVLIFDNHYGQSGSQNMWSRCGLETRKKQSNTGQSTSYHNKNNLQVLSISKSILVGKLLIISVNMMELIVQDH